MVFISSLDTIFSLKMPSKTLLTLMVRSIIVSLYPNIRTLELLFSKRTTSSGVGSTKVLRIVLILMILL